MNLDFEKGNGLIPVIVQDCENKQVLMLAYMNEQAYQATLKTGLATYWSRSRQTLWTKGETSGHFQFVQSIYYDCDQDALLLEVLQRGAACHTGNRSCFFRQVEWDHKPAAVEQAKGEALAFRNLMKTIEDRKIHPVEKSYTAYLFEKGEQKILKKVAEESGEVIIASLAQQPQDVVMESADLLYHLFVLLAQKGISLEQLEAELEKRAEKTGNLKPERRKVENY